VLYFATHGLLPGELHCQAEPGLALSPAPGAASTNLDGLLTAGEIASLKINADLVVLSACNTAAGGGGRFGGGALEGLADAFFDAGARAVIASHWQVPSGATVQLMTGMFDRLGANRAAGLAEALRQSQLALLSQPQTSHPFNWAAFTLIGDGNTVLTTVSLPAKRLAEAGHP
jgi:CHAT domain-containing protein